MFLLKEVEVNFVLHIKMFGNHHFVTMLFILFELIIVYFY